MSQLVKIGHRYVNIDNVTYVEFDQYRGRVYFNVPMSARDEEGSPISAESEAFEGQEMEQLRRWLDNHSTAAD